MITDYTKSGTNGRIESEGERGRWQLVTRCDEAYRQTNDLGDSLTIDADNPQSNFDR